jgi:hypothetical protein
MVPYQDPKSSSTPKIDQHALLSHEYIAIDGTSVKESKNPMACISHHGLIKLVFMTCLGMRRTHMGRISCKPINIIA